MLLAPAVAAARALEEGRLRGPVARGLSRVWARFAAEAIVRPLPRPAGVTLVTVGGATLGGSGKTPLAVACALELARSGARVAFVGHAYRARPRRPRVVRLDDALDDVGDEALVAASDLAPQGIPVVVAPTRAAAVAHAASLRDGRRVRDVIVVDGVLQTEPRAALSRLAVDARHPWGHAQAVPPCGDLRAPVAALQAVADRVVAVGDDASEARTFSTGVWIRGAIGDEVGDERLTWETLATLRLGLVTALARPERLVASLARHRLAPSVIVRARDHGAIPVAALRAAAPVDLWIASPKCALHARPALHAAFGARSGPPLGVLDQTVALGPSLAARLRGLAWLDPASPGQ